MHNSSPTHVGVNFPHTENIIQSNYSIYPTTTLPSSSIAPKIQGGNVSSNSSFTAHQSSSPAVESHSSLKDTLEEVR